jgi:1,4-alpha-glucan branching enzyme
MSTPIRRDFYALNAQYEQDFKCHFNAYRDECQKIEDYLSAINPNSQNYAPFANYINERIDRIETLFAAMQEKLHPLTPFDILKKQHDAVQDLINKIRSGKLNEKQIRKAVVNFPEFKVFEKEPQKQLKYKIYRAIWIMEGCPLGDPRFAERKLEKDVRVLTRKISPWFSSIEGSILEQIAHDLQTEYQIEFAKEARYQEEVDQLTRMRDAAKLQVFEARSKEKSVFNNQQIKELYQLLPDAVKLRASEQPPFQGHGINPKLYETLGVHYDRSSGITTFRIYAPHAYTIHLNLTAYHQVQECIPMTQNKETGIWEVKTPNASLGRTYHFTIVAKEGGGAFKKVDPFAFGNYAHNRIPLQDDHESVVRDIDQPYPWTDKTWMDKRAKINPAKDPMAILVLHAPSWKKINDGSPFGRPLNWNELADDLSKYCKDIGYTHVMLMGALEHPHPSSRENQTSNFFSVNSDLGTFKDFQDFVNSLHKRGIGVMMDWAPAHFSDKDFALHAFDGSALVEDDDPEVAKRGQYHTNKFVLNKRYSKDFLSSNLDFLLNKFHLDGIQFKVKPMLDSKDENVNLCAKTMLRDMNHHVHKNYPGTLTIAADTKGFHNLTLPPDQRGEVTKTRGIGFDLALDNDFKDKVTGYFSKSPSSRPAFYSELVNSVKQIDRRKGAYTSGKVVLPLTGDLFSEETTTIYGEMQNSGMSDPDKYANGRALLALQRLLSGVIEDHQGNPHLQTGKYINRMLSTMHNPNEKYKSSVQWEELDPTVVDEDNLKYHQGAQASRKALLQLCRNNPGLQDQTDAGIRHIIADDCENGVVSFHRCGGGQQFTCIVNTSSNDVGEYLLRLPPDAPEFEHLRGVKEVFSTDDTAYGGLGRGTTAKIVRDNKGHPTHLKFRLPPFTTIVLEQQF